MEDRWENLEDFARELDAIPNPELTLEEEQELLNDKDLHKYFE